jgi:tellurite methyltransferase
VPAAYDWTPFFDAVRGQGPRETLTRALDLFEAQDAFQAKRHWRFAVDLGCGTGRDTLELLRRGWRVLAIDPEPAALGELRQLVLARNMAADGLETECADFAHATWPACDLLNASFALPFCEHAHFPTLWRWIVECLKPSDAQGRGGGRFAGQFFGIDDEWNVAPSLQVEKGYPPARVFHTRAEVESLLAPFTIEHLEEVNRPGKTSTGQAKHWHVFHVVGRKQ